MADKVTCPRCGKHGYSFLHSCPGVPQKPFDAADVPMSATGPTTPGEVCPCSLPPYTHSPEAHAPYVPDVETCDHEGTGRVFGGGAAFCGRCGWATGDRPAPPLPDDGEVEALAKERLLRAIFGEKTEEDVISEAKEMCEEDPPCEVCFAIARGGAHSDWLAARDAAVARAALLAAAERVRYVRENGLPDGVTSHPTAEHFEKWLADRAEGHQ